MHVTSVRQKISLLALGLFLSLILLEGGMRFGHFLFLTLQEYRNNASIKKHASLRILCLGESTTALGGEDSYPFQLEKILNGRIGKMRVSVVDKGIPGISTAGIVLRLEDNLSKYQPNIVVVMMGINDWQDVIPHESKSPFLLEHFKSYKLVRFVWMHIVARMQEIGFFRPHRKEPVVKIDSQVSVRKNNIAHVSDAENSYLNLGNSFMCIGEYTKAEQAYKRAIETNPQSFEGHLQLASSYRLEWRFPEAESECKKAIAINPNDDFAHSLLGSLYIAQLKYEQSVPAFIRAIGLNPHNDKAYIDLAQSYTKLDRYREAEETYEKAIEIDPWRSEAYGGLASLYATLKQDKLALFYFEKANKIRLEYYNPVTRDNYKKLYAALKKRRIKLICVQYPIRGIEPLKKLFSDTDDIAFVDNEETFKNALRSAKYEDYFTDRFGGDFGHCTRKGNGLLANNIASVIVRMYFKK